MTILVFWTKFAQKEYFQPKTEKVNITIAFCLSKLVSVSNFSLNQQVFLFFRPNLSKKGYFRSKTKKSHFHVCPRSFRTGDNRQSSILMSFFLIAETITNNIHCLKKVKIRSFFWSIFSPNRGKYGTEKTPYLDTFHTATNSKKCTDKMST